jgi:hypothetical protein
MLGLVGIFETWYDAKRPDAGCMNLIPQINRLF